MRVIIIHLVFWAVLGTTALARAETTYLSDDFENGLGHWLASGSDWAVIDTTAVSPGHSVTDSPLGNYPPNSNATLELAVPVNLSGATAPVLTFWEKYSTNYGDVAIVEISDDGGFNWTELERRDQRSFVSTWTFTEISLQAHLKPLVKIRFRLRADLDGNVSDGWYLDDVAIRDADPVRTPFPFADGFDGSLGAWRVSGSDWTQIATDFVSGPNGITDSVAASYPVSTNATLELAHPIDLSHATAPVLSFWEKYSINYGDAAIIQISDDGGFHWTDLERRNQRSFVSTWTFTEISLQGHLQPLVKIRFTVRADIDGNVSDGWYLDDVAIREADPVRTPFPFSDGFDGSLGAWRVSGSDWTPIATDFVSGPNGITDSVDATYPVSTNATLELAHPMDLSHATAPVLSFWEKYSINYGDAAIIQISDDGGLHWTDLERRDQRSFVSTWTFTEISLQGHLQPLVKIRFTVRADIDGNVSDGWYLDDVAIREPDPVRTPFPFYDGFDDNLGDWRVSGSDWTPIATDFVSGPQGITDSVDANYPVSTNATLELAHPIDLSHAAVPVLSFWEKYAINYGDAAIVEISDDGGLNWTELARRNQRSFVSTWTPIQYDLSQHKGALVKVRFRLRADIDANVSDGWSLDNVEIWDLTGARCNQACRTGTTTTSTSTTTTLSSTTTSSTTTTTSSSSTSTSTTSSTSTSTTRPSSTTTSTRPSTTTTTGVSSTTTSSSSSSTTMTTPTTTTTSTNATTTSTITTTSTTTTSTTTSTTVPTCGNGVIEPPLEQCEPTEPGPCVGNSPCGSDCRCPGDSCHTLPAGAGCNDHDDCTDDDSCREGSCAGTAKCRVVVPLVTPDPRTVPVSVEAAPATKCRARLLRIVAPSVRSLDVTPQVVSAADARTGRPLSAVVRGKVASNGSLVLQLRLNPLARRLLKKNNGSLPVVAEVQLKETSGRARLLKDLVTLVGR